MAKRVKKVTTTRVSAAAIARVRAAEKATNKALTWDGCEGWTVDKFTSQFRFALQYYNTTYTGKDLKPQVVTWMTNNGYSKKDVTLYRKSKDWRTSVTLGAIAAFLNEGMVPMRPDWNNGKDSTVWLRKELDQLLIDSKEDIDDDTPKTQSVTIADRIYDAAIKMTNDFEEAIDSFVSNPNNFDPTTIDSLKILKGCGAKSPHAKIIKECYSGALSELEELANPNADEQLREGYSHLSRKNVRKLANLYRDIIAACIMLSEEAKVERKPRVKKTVSKTKMAEKMAYKKSDDQLKIVSLHPETIIGAKEVWLYNTKNRKLSKIVAQDMMTLGIKGTSITDYDINLSQQKTLRKPAEQLAAFKGAGKVALRTFFEEISSMETRASSRVSADTIILKVLGD